MQVKICVAIDILASRKSSLGGLIAKSSEQRKKCCLSAPQVAAA